MNNDFVTWAELMTKTTYALLALSVFFAGVMLGFLVYVLVC